MPNSRPNLLRIAVLASGAGHTLQAILDACTEGTLPACVVGVASNNAASGALMRASAASIATTCINADTHPEVSARDAALAATLQSWAPNVVVTAGYMQRLGPETMRTFHRRMVNVHPSLLPKFGGQGMYGRHVHAAVLAAGETESGATVHFVEGDYDSGPSIAQVRVPVLPHDDAETLATRVKTAERSLLVNVLIERARCGSFVIQPA